MRVIGDHMRIRNGEFRRSDGVEDLEHTKASRSKMIVIIVAAVTNMSLFT
jgi:hypothetical protein